MMKSLRRALDDSTKALRENRAAEALLTCEKALKRFGSSLELLNNYGLALRERGKYEEALVVLNRALLYGNNQVTLTYRAVVLRDLRRYYEALKDAQLALYIDREHGPAWAIYGTLMQEANLLPNAIDAFDRAIMRNPNATDCGLNRAFCHLLMGNYEQGWLDFNARWFQQGFVVPEFQGILHKDKGRWSGEPLEGKTIFIWHEQGLGDTLMFARYLPMLNALGATVLFKCQKPVEDLMAAQDVMFLDYMRDETVTADFHAPIGDMPRLFKTDEESIPAPARLHVPDDLLLYWGKYISAGKKVGIAWSGNPKHNNDHNRSIPFVLLHEQLLKHFPDVHFYAVQHDINPSDLRAFDDSEVVHFGDRVKSMQDTAAIMHHMDLIVSVDTASLHLAGSLGKPALGLIPFHPDWRWGMEKETTAWYSNVKLLRQKQRGDWTDVLARVTETLKGV